jgi:hypothetical protein
VAFAVTPAGIRLGVWAAVAVTALAATLGAGGATLASAAAASAFAHTPEYAVRLGSSFWAQQALWPNWQLYARENAGAITLPESCSHAAADTVTAVWCGLAASIANGMLYVTPVWTQPRIVRITYAVGVGVAIVATCSALILW